MFKNIEFLRFSFSLMIVYFHMIPMMPKSDIFLSLAKASGNAYIIVEFFLIIAGYFLYNTIKKQKELSFLDFSINKFFRLWPTYIFGILSCIVLTRQVSFSSFISSAFFMKATGLTLEFRGIDWFVSPFFWIMLFYFAFFKVIERKLAHFLLAIIVYFSLVLLVNNGFGGRDVKFGFISFAILRAIASIGLGYLLAMFINLKKDKFSFIKNKLFLKIIFSLIEIISLGILSYYLLLAKPKFNNIILIVIFVVLLFSYIEKKGILSNLLNLDIFVFLGKYSYSIYIMQIFSFCFLERTFWKCDSFLINNPVWSIFLSLSFCTTMGVITYYLIEKPAFNFYKRNILTKQF